MSAPLVALVVIEHTGDPAQYPTCERVMHEPAAAATAAATAGAQQGLALPASLTTCGAEIEFYAVEEPRSQTGYNWCPSCFPGRKPRSFFREYSLINRANGMVHAERGAIAQQERLLPRPSKKEDEQTKLARLEIKAKKLRVDRAELLADRARQMIDRQRVAELDDAHPNVLAALDQLDHVTSQRFAAAEADISAKESKLSRKPPKLEPKRKKLKPKKKR